MEKSLVILIGNARGGEKTWSTLYTNLLDIYNADLLLCFGKVDTKNSSLYNRAKYIYEIEEYDDWTNYYNNYFNDNWYSSFLHGQNHGLAGGLKQYTGSGSIIFAFRHFLKTNCLDIINLYDRIILTRSDHFYLYPHPILSNTNIWIPQGEDYDGITDRFHVFPSEFAQEMLGIVEYMDSDIGFKQITQVHNPNPEIILKLAFTNNRMIKNIKRYKRCQFTVATETDSTRWRQGSIKLPDHDDLLIKYPYEYIMALKNKKTQ